MKDAVTRMRGYLNDTCERELDKRGFTVLPGFADAALVAELRESVEGLFLKEGDAAGSEFKQEAGARRLANLLDKGDVFQRIVVEPRVLALVRHVLGPDFKLSSCNARSAEPHTSDPQPLHCDMGAVPDKRGAWVCNVVWMLDPFTPENGALRAVPGTHCSGKLPQDELADPQAPHPEEVLVTGPAGTAAVFNAHLWHGGLPNHTDRPRLAVHAFYCRGDKPQQQYQKQLLRPETQAALSPSLRKLLALDDPRNDALSREVTVRSGFLK